MHLFAGMYYTFIKDWKEVFGKDMMIISSEIYYKNRIPHLQQIARFLNIGMCLIDITLVSNIL